MGVVTIMCTQTGRQVSTGLRVDEAGFQAMTIKPSVMRCWACGGEHPWSKRWAIVSEVDPDRMKMAE